MRGTTGQCMTLVAQGLLGLTLASGCAQIRETYYVSAVSENGAMQIYRFHLRGSAGITRVKYASGFYPAEALEAVAGEYAELGEALRSSSPATSEESQNYFIAGPEGHFQQGTDVRLAIIMSADPKPVTDAIQAVAKNEDLARLLEQALQPKSVEPKDPIGRHLPPALREILRQKLKQLQADPTNPLARAIAKDIESVLPEETEHADDGG